MAGSIKSMYDSEIAIIEHDLITENEVFDWKAEDAQWFLSGVHAMAQAVIDKIREKEGF